MTTRVLAFAILVLVCVAALALGIGLAPHTNQPAAAVVSCHSVAGLPDSTCTPGATDPRVTQDNVRSTICSPGYAVRARPPADYTDMLKKQQIAEYGYTDTNPSHYEEDHLIPLSLGGHPTDPKNLWPQPRRGENSAAHKDVVEAKLHDRVCAGKMRLSVARSAIATNWRTAAS